MSFQLISDFAEGACEHCGTGILIANLSDCVICNGFNNACPACLLAHRDKHTPVEFEEFKREMMGAPGLTLRERHALELKAQLRAHTETLCKLIDDQEALVKKFENQCRVLAAELDRVGPTQ